MSKRYLLIALAALTLSALLASNASGDVPSPLATDSAAPYALEDGAIEIPLGTSGNELLACLADRSGITLTAAAGTELDAADDVASGSVISRGGESAIAVVPGDVNGDAQINVRDVIAAMRAVLGASVKCERAADVYRDKTVNARDVQKLMRSLVGWDETLGKTPVAAANEDAALTLYFDSILHRIRREDTQIHGGAIGIYYCAKNEVEDAQIILTSTEARSDLELFVGAPTNAAGDELAVGLRYGYYYAMAMFNDLKTQDFGNITYGNWVDPYPPYDGAFPVGANESKSFMAQITVPADAKSGWYRAPVVVKDPEGRELKRASIHLYVWDFALDEETACNTLFSTWSSGTAGYYRNKYDPKYSSGEIWAPIYKEQFYDYFLKYRISGYELPYDILDSRVDEYLDNPRVTAFVSKGGMGNADLTSDSERSRVRRIYDKLETKAEWLEKAYVYTVDEPWQKEGADLVVEQWNNISSILGETPFKTIVPYGNTFISEEKKDQLDYLWDYCNCFCPSEGVFTPNADTKARNADPVAYPTWGEYMDKRQFQKYGNYQPRYEQLRERGDSMWWYVCVSPEYPYANFFNYYQGDWSRIVLWLQYIVHSDGLLYWATNSWTVSEHDGRLINLKRTNTGGDGLLIYDGMLWGASGPSAVPTSRLEAIRDGIEDFQYMKQLERQIGREAVLEKFVTRLATDVTHFSQDYRFMEKVRNEMGFMLEGLED